MRWYVCVVGTHFSDVTSPPPYKKRKSKKKKRKIKYTFLVWIILHKYTFLFISNNFIGMVFLCVFKEFKVFTWPFSFLSFHYVCAAFLLSLVAFFCFCICSGYSSPHITHTKKNILYVLSFRHDFEIWRMWKVEEPGEVHTFLVFLKIRYGYIILCYWAWYICIYIYT